MGGPNKYFYILCELIGRKVKIVKKKKKNYFLSFFEKENEYENDDGFEFFSPLLYQYT